MMFGFVRSSRTVPGTFTAAGRDNFLSGGRAHVLTWIVTERLLAVVLDSFPSGSGLNGNWNHESVAL